VDVVSFYSVGDDFGEFSNFALFPIILDGSRWPTSEHYFQAQKFADPTYREKIRSANSPMLASRLGRDRKQKLRRDWESVKVGIMRMAVLAKFSQHADLRDLLLCLLATQRSSNIPRLTTIGVMVAMALAKTC
jgi:N-glycosidase YbiA